MNTHTADHLLTPRLADAVPGKSLADVAVRLRSAHEVSGHDKWFKQQVELAIQEADSQAAQWVSAGTAKSSWQRKRGEWTARVGGNT